LNGLKDEMMDPQTPQLHLQSSAQSQNQLQNQNEVIFGDSCILIRSRALNGYGMDVIFLYFRFALCLFIFFYLIYVVLVGIE
jgi:hypothetical protein